MKFKLPIGVCILISLVLVLFGLLYGTASGFNEDRAQVTSLLEGDNGLLDIMRYRGADGLNLCVVARRHLTGDADVEALAAAANKLRADGDSINDKKLESESLDAAVSAVAGKLRQTESFIKSERDGKYLDMLVTDMQDLAKSALATSYNEAAGEFNKSLETSLFGKIAAWLGVKPCELYE